MWRGNDGGLFCGCTSYVDPFLIVRIELSYGGAGGLYEEKCTKNEMGETKNVHDLAANLVFFLVRDVCLCLGDAEEEDEYGQNKEVLFYQDDLVMSEATHSCVFDD